MILKLLLLFTGTLVHPEHKTTIFKVFFFFFSFSNFVPYGLLSFFVILKCMGYCTSGPYFWRLGAFSQKKKKKKKATLDKVSYGSGQKFSKELTNHSFTSVQTIVVKLQ